ncbi:MAG TPA: hypothetical protein VNM90_13460, partial [Haliangium sp.]|nr:hypothetical protein [Haliangium sp.]
MTETSLRAALMTFLVAGWSGCAFDADYSRTRYQCEDGACPSGYTCRSGRCEPLSSGVAPGELDGCGTTDLLANDFQAEALDEQTDWYRWGNVVFSHVEGRLQAGHEDPASYIEGGYETRRLYLLRGSRVFVEVPDYVPVTDGGAQLVLQTPGGPDVRFEVWGTELYLNYAYAGDRYTLAKLTYDPAAHRFWQVREEQGTLYWETSADGQTWEIQASTSSLPFSDLVGVKLLVNLPPDTGPVFFDNVNGGALPEDESWCAIDSISDDFDDGLVGPAWSTWDSGTCLFFERDGALYFEYPPEGNGDCGYASATRYDLTGNAIAVEVPQVDETGLIRTLFVLDFLNGNYISLEHGNFGEEATNRVVCRNRILGANATPCSLEYDSELHRWWRFRHDDGEDLVHWETSPDGEQWTSQ